jgi:hypothetical protein
MQRKRPATPLDDLPVPQWLEFAWSTLSRTQHLNAETMESSTPTR